MRIPDSYKDRLWTAANVASAVYRSEIVYQKIGQVKGDNRDLRILDVGFGQGELLHLLRKAGYSNIMGVDYLQSCVDRLSADGFSCAQLDLNAPQPSWPGEKFDVIVAMEVIEHLFDPAVAISSMIDRLLPRGVLILSVPNEYRLRKRLDFLRGHEIGDPTIVGGHIKFFSFNRIRKLVESFDVSIVDHFGAGAQTIYSLPFGSKLATSRPDLFEKWTFVVAQKREGATT